MIYSESPREGLFGDVRCMCHAGYVPPTKMNSKQRRPLKAFGPFSGLPAGGFTWVLVRFEGLYPRSIPKPWPNEDRKWFKHPRNTTQSCIGWRSVGGRLGTPTDPNPPRPIDNRANGRPTAPIDGQPTGNRAHALSPYSRMPESFPASGLPRLLGYGRVWGEDLET